MFVFFFRHGDRLAGNDSLLSPIGQKQATGLPAFLSESKIIIPAELWVSPKKRARQTFEILASEKNLRCEVVNELDERSSKETAIQFRKRVQAVIDRIPSVDRDLFICSHFDWLEEAMVLIPDQGRLQIANFHWPAGGFVGFEVEDENWKSYQQGQVTI